MDAIILLWTCPTLSSPTVGDGSLIAKHFYLLSPSESSHNSISSHHPKFDQATTIPFITRLSSLIQRISSKAPAMASSTYLDLDWRMCVSRGERIERLDQIWHDIANNMSVQGMISLLVESSWRLKIHELGFIHHIRRGKPDCGVVLEC